MKMKMNVNRACDLSSISVFPPHARRSNAGMSEPRASQQLRSQQSQQSFSQGLSSQRGGFSQLTQSSLEEAMANDQRFSSQERDLPLKKVSCLPPINNKREDNQIVLSRSSSNLPRRRNPAFIPESRCQTDEELEQRIGMMETSLNRFGMILDSIQSDVMQVNKGTKEVSLETERIWQKLILHDTSLQWLTKEQADVKASLDGGVKSILEQLSKDPSQEKLQKILLMLTTIPEQIESSVRKLQREICNNLTREIQAVASLKMADPRVQMSTAPQMKAMVNVDLPKQQGSAPKRTAPCTTALNQRQPQHSRNSANTFARAVKTSPSPTIQAGCWKSVKPEDSDYKKRAAPKQERFDNLSLVEQAKQCTVVIDSDEDIDGGFSCLLEDNKKGNIFVWEAEKETERVLRRARRTKRKYDNPIIIN